MVKVTTVVRLKHAGLYSLAEAAGSQAKLAALLGVTQTTVGGWINLKQAPPMENAGPRRKPLSGDKLKQFDKVAVDLKGCLWSDIVEADTADAVLALKGKTKIVAQHEVEVSQLCLIAESAIPAIEHTDFEVVDSEDDKPDLDRYLNQLKAREREIIKLRFGLGDGTVYNLDEVGHIFKITRERVRQLEMRGIRQLANMLIRDEVYPTECLALVNREIESLNNRIEDCERGIENTIKREKEWPDMADRLQKQRQQIRNELTQLTRRRQQRRDVSDRLADRV